VKELEGACVGGHMYRGPGTTLGSNWALALGSAINHLQPGVCHTGGSQGAPAKINCLLQNNSSYFAPSPPPPSQIHGLADSSTH
jgi:hypothetical protein